MSPPLPSHSRLSSRGKPRASALVSIALLVTSASLRADDGSDASGAEKITYDDHIVPIFRDACFGCHNPDKKKSGLALSTYPLLMEGGSSGEVIQPGDPDASRLFLLVAHREEPYMPPRKSKLPDASLELIRKWIAGGAPENRSSRLRASAKPALALAAGATGTRPEGPPPVPRGVSLEPTLRTPRTTAVTALAASPWDPLVAVAGQKQVLVYHADTAELLGVFPFPEGSAQVLKFSRNGRLLLAGGGRGAHSGQVVVFDVKSGERLIEVGNEFDSVLAADISPDHRLIALGGPSRTLRVYSTSDGVLLHEIEKHTDWIFAIEFSPDGVLLASGDRNGGLHVWESLTGREYLALRGHGGAVSDLSWRSDSNILASSSEDGTVRLWEMENGGQVKRWNAHGGGALSLEFLRDGRLVSCGRDRVARLWDQNGGQQRVFEAFSDLALEVTASHDGGMVIAGDWTGEVRGWSAADGKRRVAFPVNPPALADRLQSASAELAAMQKRHDELAAALAKLADAATRVSGELEAARQAAAAAEAKRGTAEQDRDAKREAADRASLELQESLKKLAAREDAHEQAIMAAKPNPQEIEKTASELATAQKLAADAAALVRRRLEERAAARERLAATRAEAGASAARVTELAERARASSEEAGKEREGLAEVTALLERARTRRQKWAAASELEKALGELKLRRDEQDELQTRLEGLRSAEATATATASAVEGAIEVAAAAAIELSRAAEQLAAGGIAEPSASKESSAGEAETDGTAKLARALARAAKGWEELQERSEEAAGRIHSLQEQLVERLAAVEKARAARAEHEAAVARSRESVEAAQRVVDRWSDAIEAARAAPEPD